MHSSAGGRAIIANFGSRYVRLSERLGSRCMILGASSVRRACDHRRRRTLCETDRRRGGGQENEGFPSSHRQACDEHLLGQFARARRGELALQEQADLGRLGPELSTAATNQSTWRRKSWPSQRIFLSEDRFFVRPARTASSSRPAVSTPSRAAAVKEARRAPRSGAQRPGRPRARRHPYRSGTTRQLSRQTIVTSRPPATGNAVVRRLGADLAGIAVRF